MGRSLAFKRVGRLYGAALKQSSRRSAKYVGDVAFAHTAGPHCRA